LVFGLSIPVAFAAPGVAPFTWILLLPIGRVLRHAVRAEGASGAGGRPRRRRLPWRR
jgi:hypothetical protein